MIPVVPAPRPAAPAEAQRAVRTESGSDFSSYLERKAAVKSRERQDLLGAGQRQPTASDPARSAGRARQAEQASGRQTATEDNAQAATVATILAQFMNELRQTAETTAPVGSEWSFAITDPAQLQGLAESAGLSDAERASLTKAFEDQGGRIDLSELLAFLSRHFEAMQDQQPVTMPETDLPLLQNLLERVGVGAEDAARIGAAAVRGDNTIDLEQLLAGLNQLETNGITTLSPVEAEQLQEMLAQAGVSLPTQHSLLPERLPLWQEQIAGQAQPGLSSQELAAQLQQMEQPVQLTLERLKNIIQQGVEDVKGGRLQADLPVFLADLRSLLNRSGLAGNSPGWTPAVQGAVTAIFDRLMESVDLAQVRVQQGNQLSELVAERRAEAEAMAADAEWEEGFFGELDQLAGETAGVVRSAEGNGADGPPAERQGEGAFVAGEQNGVFHAEAVSARQENNAPANAQHAAPVRPFMPVPGMGHELQRQGFAQISQGVLQGLRNQEHHLVLKLYPKELGEVRVEMMVREEQVAVSFAMENSRVKEMLESNLSQFRQNMEQQGFVLGECMVSVNQNNEGNEAWQRFQEAWQAEGVAGPRAATLADLPEDILYQRIGGSSSRENGVDLFA
ncbi:MAG: flagellar hook-length control protein FliK [Thermodesulfobacteriota bacterium]